MPLEIDRGVFVVGAPRSGTTLVQSLLATHRSVTSFTESHFFSRHFRLLPLGQTAILVKSPAARVHEFLAENEIDSERAAAVLAAVGGISPAAVPLPWRTRLVARRLLEVLDLLTLQRGRSSWIEKTPKHLRYVPFLERISSSERRTDFVHVIREGIDVAASLHLASQSWERPYDLETCARRWNDDVAYSLRRSDSPRDHFVFYEDLTADPEGTVRDLLSALALDWQPDVLERYGEIAKQLMTPEETWKNGVERQVRRSATSVETLTAADRRRTTAALRPELYRMLHEACRNRGGAANR